MELALYPKYIFRSLFVHGRQDFFSAGYKLLHPECRRRGMTPWQHYVTEGRRKGFDNGSHPSETIFFSEGYLLEYPDIKAAGIDPWHHYAEKGLAEGRDNGLHPGDRDFFAAGYLEMYPDVAGAGMDPWHHYVLKGKKEGSDNGLHPGGRDFFAAGYLEMYPDAARSGMDPWHHYVLKGKKEGRDNGLHPADQIFSARCYLEMYRDIAKSGVDPWHHYVLIGKKEGRHKKRAATFQSYTDWVFDLSSNKRFFVPDDDRLYIRHPGDPKIFAYYLPQFHAIPINDQNYGKGFTEWTNVTRATPLFKGHYQPKVPYDLGFYSLDHAEVLERQAALARQYGIYGFCFYYYWFGGNKVMEKPLRLFLNSKIDFKFHLMWANENWSKLWDGGSREMILEQKQVDPSMAEIFYKDIRSYITDRRYERIDNRPVFAIYRPNFFDRLLFCEFLERLNKLARMDGFDGFYFLGTNYRSFAEPERYGLEGLIEFPPHGLWDIGQAFDVEWFNLKANAGIIDLHEWIKNQYFIDEKPFKVFKCCFPHWDNSPRKAYSYGSIFRMQKDDFYNTVSAVIRWDVLPLL